MSGIQEPTKRLTHEEIALKVAVLTKGSAFDKRKEEKKAAINARVAEMKKRLAGVLPQEREKVRSLVEKAIEEAEMHRNLSKVMVHIDFDAFYASVEIRDNPSLADKPIAVGSMSMLSTTNYIARQFGCKSAMPGFVAKKLCPNLIILPHNFQNYSAVSRQGRQIFAEYCPEYSTMGLDEAYLDLTEYLESRLLGKTSNQVVDFEIPESLRSRVGCKCCDEVVENSQPRSKEEVWYCPKCKLLKCEVGQRITFGNSAWSVVEELRFKVLLATQLTTSAGIAPNTMIAKIASDMRKPNGQFMVRSERQEILRLMETMKVGTVPMIGFVSQSELAGLGIETCGQLRERLVDIFLLYSEGHFGFLMHAALGMGATHLEHGGPRKSIGTETTFSKTCSIEKLLEIIKELCVELSESCEEEQICGKTFTLKLKTADFRNYTRAGSCPGKNTYFLPQNKGEDMFQVAKSLLEKEFAANGGKLWIRLAGARLSNLKDLSELEQESANSISTLLTKPSSKKRKNEADTADEESKRRHTSEVVTILSDEDVQVEEVLSSSSDSNMQSFECPICNAKFPRMTLLKFNQHIDECLNRSAIRMLKEEENLVLKSNESSKVPEMKRTISNSNNRKSNSPPGKKPPSSNGQQKSILNFFQKP